MEKIIRAYIEKKKLWELVGFEKNYKISFLAQGEYNKNYLLSAGASKYVFRVNFGSQIEVANQVEYEFMTLKSLQHTGVVPKVFFVDSSQKDMERGLLVMEYLEGRPLEYQKDLEKAAVIFSKIHATSFDEKKHKDFIIEKNLFSDRIKEAKGLLKNVWSSSFFPKEVKKIFEKFFQYLEKNVSAEKYFQTSDLSINNTEVNSHNFIIGEKNHYLIDWEKAVFSDVCQDLCHFLAPTTTLWKADYFLSRGEQEDFIKCYCKQSGLSFLSIQEKINLYNPYLYLRALSWCAFAYIEYQAKRELTNQDTYRKIEQYLEVGFLKKILQNWIT
jgi:predicted Ser/Thr protein kinase